MFALTAVDFTQAESNAVTNFGNYNVCYVIANGWQQWYAQVSRVKP